MLQITIFFPCSSLWNPGHPLCRRVRRRFPEEVVSPLHPLQPIPPWVSSPWSLFPLRQSFPLLPFRVRPRLRSDSPQKLTLRRLPPRLRRAAPPPPLSKKVLCARG